MKIYRLKSGLLIDSKNNFYLFENFVWDKFVNDDNLFFKTEALIKSAKKKENAADLIKNELYPPIQTQEIWASGVTYFNSKLARQEESKDAGGVDFYAQVYVADRPELFFKSTAERAVGSGKSVRIRQDSTWNVPEPELTLFITSNKKIVGYTIGNDMSSRSIEGENPLYLPQAKNYDRSASIGPCLFVPEKPIAKETKIEMVIIRNNEMIFKGITDLGKIKRDFEDLVLWLFRETTFPNGCFLMTGTGIIPPTEFTLQKADEIRITIEPIGTLINFVE